MLQVAALAIKKLNSKRTSTHFFTQNLCYQNDKRCTSCCVNFSDMTTDKLIIS